MAPKVEMNPNRKKIIESILLLIEEASKAGFRLTQYDIVKSIFIADVFHLKKYGRPISFDNYAALPFGPVPSETYNMLKPGYDGTRHFGDEWPFWDRVSCPERGGNSFEYLNPKRAANRRRLSQTDMNEIQDAFQFVRTEGFSGVKDWTHMLEAYTSAWKARGTKKSSPMDYHLLGEGLDAEVVSNLVHASHFMK